jgi:hypothetical protein
MGLPITGDSAVASLSEVCETHSVMASTRRRVDPRGSFWLREAREDRGASLAAAMRCRMNAGPYARSASSALCAAQSNRKLSVVDRPPRAAGTG